MDVARQTATLEALESRLARMERALEALTTHVAGWVDEDRARATSTSLHLSRQLRLLPVLAAIPAPPSTLPLLTRREWQVVELIAQGLSNQEIATALVVSKRTVESHVSRIFEKLGLTSRCKLVAWARDHGA